VDRRRLNLKQLLLNRCNRNVGEFLNRRRIAAAASAGGDVKNDPWINSDCRAEMHVSWPSMWLTSTLRLVPQNAHCFWRVSVGAIPESSIGDLMGFLAPLLPIPASPGSGQSWSSSSASSEL
jgi:hypothetical protein